ncbi:MAG: hypothetical protein J5606_05530 [Bacteroidales bacterium]|nr:hypothetical protein [Bacteroidales bacterium]
MKKHLALKTLVVLLSICSCASAQKWVGQQHMLSFSMGWSTMMGDLGGSAKTGTHGLKDFDYQAMAPVYTLGYSFTQNKNTYVGVAFKTDLSYTRFNSSDGYSEEIMRNHRALSRVTDVVELTAGIEFYFLKQTMSAFKKSSFGKSAFGRKTSGNCKYRSGVISGIPLSMYLILQGGVFWWDCKGKYTDDKWYSLRKLYTEGQGLLKTRKKPSLIQGSGVLGLGIKRVFTPSFAMKIEATMHITTTDYLDDVSTTFFSPKAVYDQVLAETNDEKKAEMARYFASGNDPDGASSPGQIRGNAINRDAFFFVEIGACYVISNQKRSRSRY